MNASNPLTPHIVIPTPALALLIFLEDARTRFQAKCEVADCGCIKWKPSRGWKEYGSLWLGKTAVRANRLALALSGRFPTPEAPHSLHSCDRPACVNDQHLRWGNNSENVQESYDRNPAMRARQVDDIKKMVANRRKLTQQEVDVVKAHLSTGEGGSSIARKLGLLPNIVSRIKLGLYKPRPLALPTDTREASHE